VVTGLGHLGSLEPGKHWNCVDGGCVFGQRGSFDPRKHLGGSGVVKGLGHLGSLEPG